MLRVVLAQVLRRRGRSLAVVAAIVVAAVSFSLLTSAVATSRLQVASTVQANFRSAYDILVRPKNSTTPLEHTRGLVQESYLSGIYGGISMNQYHRVQEISGVEVAAPVALVGYMLPHIYPDYDITNLVGAAREQLFRITQPWTSDRGLSSFATPNNYVYVTGARVHYGYLPRQTDPLTGKQVSPCNNFSSVLASGGLPASAFDDRLPLGLACFSTNPPTPAHWAPWLPAGRIGVEGLYQYPVLLAAIDPAAEAKLVGLDQAVVSGRYLRASDRTTVANEGGGAYHSVPVLMANRPLSDDTLTVNIQRLHIPHPNQVPSRLSSPGGPTWIQSLTGPTIRSTTLTNQQMYPRLLAQYSDPHYLAQAQYWSAGTSDYRTALNGRLTVTPTRNPASTWIDQLSGGYVPPADAADPNYRRLQVHAASNQIIGGVLASPIVRPVGTFDPTRIAGFSKLSEVPLTTYYPPSAAPADARTSRLLHGRPLLPNSNLAGYLQQPPMMLTTIRSLSSFSDSNAFTNTDQLARAPISVIRIRVAGVTGPDQLSRERVRLVAEQIIRQTGLDVDVTVGSSPTPQLIDLPPGTHGRPALTIREGWVQKGAAVRLLSAIDAKSLALFVLVLVVCGLFLLNATVAAARTRRIELGVLACLGWPRRRIFALLEIELLVTGLVAGLVGTGLAAGLTVGLGLHTTSWQLVLVTPVSTALAGAAGLGPSWRASHARPVEAITPAVRPPRRGGRVRSITRLAIVGVIRWPGRTVLGAASLFIGVAALAVLIAIQAAFQGGSVGTLLGDAIAVQVRPVDYLAAGLTIGLGAFAVADIAYLNMAERTAEIGTLRASGWAESHLRRLFGTEAMLTASFGTISGAVAGVVGVAILFPMAWRTAVITAVTAGGIGIIAAIIALTVPLSRLSALAPRRRHHN